ncbi:MAG: aminotransferase class I/II-fold pyridoxal phosphate-dependent enzyme, partial [Gaiellaceae bacterium]
MTGPRLEPVPLAADFSAYAWASSSDAVAELHGLRPEQILRFDQNTPSLPGVPQIPLAESFARLNDYPDGTYRELREAAAGYVGLGTAGWQQIVVGAGADDLILLCARTFLREGRRVAITAPTYVVYREASQLAGAEIGEEIEGADLIWRCNPNNPTGEVIAAADLVVLARSLPRTPVVVDEAYVEFGGESVIPFLPEAPNLIVLRTMSKAFGFASLRVGYAVAAPHVAAVLEERRAPAPVAGPAARIAAAALREPRLDVVETVAERERVRDALVTGGFDAPPTATNFVYVRSEKPLGAELEAQGLVVRTVPGGIRITLRRPNDNDVLLRAFGIAVEAPAPGRGATVIRTTTETALRITLDIDGSSRVRLATGIGFLDHLLTLMAFHAGFDLDVVAGGDLDVDEHHTVEDVLGSLGDALAQALGTRAGVTRYGTATVPMDEARAMAAVDLVRRPHAEIELEFTGDRVGGLAL